MNVRGMAGRRAASLTGIPIPRRWILVGMMAAALPGLAFAQSPVQSALNRDLRDAALRGDSAVIARLIAAGADPEARDDRGRTALLIATDGNRIAAARVLMSAGADVNAQDDVLDSPYLLAGARGYVEILRLALDNGADVRSLNRFGGTALIPACERGHVEAVRILIAAGVDVDHVNNLGWTGLLEAVILGDGGPAHGEVVRLLIVAKADVNLADRDGVTPLAHARKRGQREIEALLRAAGGR